MVNLACARAWRQWRNELISIRRAELLFAPTRRVFEEFQRQGTPLPTRRAVVPNPVTVPADWHNDEDREPTVLFVGRLDFGKGVGRLPSIMSALWKQLPQTRLTIAGGDFYARGIGSVRAWLTKRFGSFTHRVHFAGEVGATELDELYRRAWIVVVPSRWDSCSNATLEAMARAKAVVASPHGGMAELLEGTAAPVADPDRPDFAAAAARLLSEKSQRQALGRALQRQAGERFHPDRVAELYCQFTAREIGGAA
jgi:glycogen synthase